MRWNYPSTLSIIAAGAVLLALGIHIACHAACAIMAAWK